MAVLATLFGCSKKSDDPGGNSARLSGKYSLYKEVDTTFSPTDVLVETLVGDTLYLNYGTKDLDIIPDAIAQYDPKALLTDTLNFLSATSGVETGLGYSVPYPFSYSLQAGTFNDGNNVNNGSLSLTFTLSQPNSTTVKILVIQKTGNIIEDSNASYYKKL